MKPIMNSVMLFRMSFLFLVPVVALSVPGAGAAFAQDEQAEIPNILDAPEKPSAEMLEDSEEPAAAAKQNTQAQSPLANGSSGKAASQDQTMAPQIPQLEDKPIAEDNIFYDADALVPAGEISKAGPKKVNPRNQPASTLVVVKKGPERDSMQAQLIAADRAGALGRLDSALEIYDALYMKNNRDARVLMGRAITLQKLGKAEAAIEAYEQVLDVQPDSIDAKINIAGLLGQRYPAVALQRLDELRAKNPRHVGIAAQMAVVQAQSGLYKEAVESLGVAASLEPTNPLHYFNMAVIADRAGEKKQAVQYYEKALEVDTRHAGGRAIPRESVFERLGALR